MNTLNHPAGQELLAYLNNDIDSKGKHRVQEHLANCEACQKELESLNALWSDLSQLKTEQPSEEMSLRFYDSLKAYESGLHEGRMTTALPEQKRQSWLDALWPKQPAFQVGLAFALLVVGLLIGARFTPQTQQQATGSTEFTELRQEVRQMQRLLTVSLLQQQSASERLRGVSWSRTAESDPEVVAALLKTLKYDANVNVRLAALDALSSIVDASNIRQELLQSLPKQTSPLVQIAMVDLMVDLKEKQSAGVFRQMVTDPELNPSVKERIQQALRQL